MVTNIQVPDRNDSFSRIVLNGKEYLIRFTFNAKKDYWSFGFYDMSENPILAMTKIVPLSPMTFFYREIDVPDGEFICLTDLEKVGRNDFKNSNAVFTFIPMDMLS